MAARPAHQGGAEDALVPILVLLPFVLLQVYLLGMVQALERFGEYNVQQVVPNLLAFVGMAVVLLWLNGGLLGAVYMQAGIVVFVTVWLALRVHRLAAIRLRFDLPLGKEMLAFGGKSYLQTLAATLHLRIDQYMIGYLLDFGEEVVSIARGWIIESVNAGNDSVVLVRKSDSRSFRVYVPIVPSDAAKISPHQRRRYVGAAPKLGPVLLTALEQEETILLPYPDAHEENMREILFVRETSELLAIWEGHKLTKAEASRISGIKRVEWLSEFRPLFHRLMCECEHVFLNWNEHKRAVLLVETREDRFVRETQRRYPLHDYQRLARLMQQLRAVKSEPEVAAIRRACDITRAGFQRVCRFVKPGVTETQVEAEFAHEFIRIQPELKSRNP